MATFAKRSSYGIFVRFRRTRLTLKRGIVRLEDAIALAQQLRAARFHDPGDVFLVKEPEGLIIDLPASPLEGSMQRSGGDASGGASGGGSPLILAALREPAAPQPAPSSTAPDPVEEPTAASPGERQESLPIPDGRAGTQSPTVPTASLRAFDEAPVDARLRLDATIDRAHAAHARLELAFRRAGRALDHAGEPPPEDLRRMHARLGAVCAEAARSIASFEHVAALISRRVAPSGTDPS